MFTKIKGIILIVLTSLSILSICFPLSMLDRFQNKETVFLFMIINLITLSYGLWKGIYLVRGFKKDTKFTNIPDNIYSVGSDLSFIKFLKISLLKLPRFPFSILFFTANFILILILTENTSQVVYSYLIVIAAIVFIEVFAMQVIYTRFNPLNGIINPDAIVINNIHTIKWKYVHKLTMNRDWIIIDTKTNGTFILKNEVNEIIEENPIYTKDIICCYISKNL